MLITRTTDSLGRTIVASYESAASTDLRSSAQIYGEKTLSHSFRTYDLPAPQSSATQQTGDLGQPHPVPNKATLDRIRALGYAR